MEREERCTRLSNDLARVMAFVRANAGTSAPRHNTARGAR
jgi:hypothetical protein